MTNEYKTYTSDFAEELDEISDMTGKNNKINKITKKLVRISKIIFITINVYTCPPPSVLYITRNLVSASSVLALKKALVVVETAITTPKKPYELGPSFLAIKIPTRRFRRVLITDPPKIIVLFLSSFFKLKFISFD